MSEDDGVKRRLRPPQRVNSRPYSALEQGEDSTRLDGMYNGTIPGAELWEELREQYLKDKDNKSLTLPEMLERIEAGVGEDVILKLQAIMQSKKQGDELLRVMPQDVYAAVYHYISKSSQ